MIWRYFDKTDLYKEKCKFCSRLFLELDVNASFLKYHLNVYHRQQITTAIQKEVVANNSLLQYFKFDKKGFNATCIFCKSGIDIFYGIDIFSLGSLSCL